MRGLGAQQLKRSLHFLLLCVILRRGGVVGREIIVVFLETLEVYDDPHWLKTIHFG